MSVTPTPSSSELCYLIEGMDCAECAQKIEALVGRTPGAFNPRVTFSTQLLRLDLDESRTHREALEAAIRRLGYEPRLRSPNPSPTPQAALFGLKTRQGRLVLGSGALLGLAFLLGWVEPHLAHWGYIGATLVGIGPLAVRAWGSARLGNPFSINTLVTVAALGAVLIGAAAESAVVVFLFAVGELLEGLAAQRARAGIQALASLTPKTAWRVEGGQVREVPAESLRIGQVVQVEPGGRVPADGTILSGHSAFDESAVTGESLPVSKGIGQTVYAGSINTDGVITLRVDRNPQDNTLARILHLVEEAQESKAPTARLIDRFSRFYTPGVLLVALLVAIVPPLLLGAAWHEWLYKGLALLLIGCPCALVLSVPAAITSAISAGARQGLLIKGGAVLETLASTRTVVFDKTGTLTLGQPTVTDVLGLELPAAEVLRLAAAVEGGSAHPLARAIREKAEEAPGPIPSSSNGQAIKGKAAIAQVEGRTLAVGSPRYAAELAPLEAPLAAQIEGLECQGKTVVVLMNPPKPLGLIALRDEPRPEAARALAELSALGLRSVMLTGDNAHAAKGIAATLELEASAELMPEDKLRRIAQLQSRGTVVMVGDGINDAPALAQADVGIAMGSGTEVALEAADAALLHNSVQGVVGLIRLSRNTLRIIVQNIALALGLKGLFLVTTLLGLTGLWPAVLADTGATALVTANSLRLLRSREALAPQNPVKH